MTVFLPAALALGSGGYVTVFLPAAIPSFYIVISLEDPLKINSDGRRINTKFRCSKEEKAMKVNLGR